MQRADKNGDKENMSLIGLIIGVTILTTGVVMLFFKKTIRYSGHFIGFGIGFTFTQIALGW